MVTSVVRPYRGVDAETRRSQRRQQLLESCLAVAAEDGVASVSVEAICARAGLSKRYFYESYRDRDAILVAALDGVFAQLSGQLADQLEICTSIRSRVALTATALVEVFSADPRAAHLYTSAPANPALEARRRQVVDEFTPVLIREVLGADPSDLRARAITMVMVAGTCEVLDRWLRGDLGFTKGEFIQTLTDLGQSLADSL
ncbi:TetR/AcrR family transcriptional regulator [Rhodococcus sp. T7]|uniref:TetR/AcrR family transcriptional regulator n=1 Tax=Rhodococcus sp. T7 TaxID=627444 RepID=UPI0013575AC5|nr:TetR family transcriptional regulator [Rhodococcus sp. T7]KAF0963600.1 hypothetical protein MLGJGCBP_03270 [Rhodococcus sp. T7]